ncbi:DUF4434 domain-containing protein [Euhalothece natronophila Z-M001]|uniref:DUF4434 domain-containing protein n=1 Tax=Euhalothece natronophila Z-M001 TaxID=522448 RepID=A0A5B8NII3_9CHRO|nr:DUF4434 domain-containing protein [Euhalothece natronophila]QDZ38756.1 DUF4434 domain-containing protein [Euhalothece natronophila Z-M001]
MKPALTGTFLDEITHDIPSQNWRDRDWDNDFATMKEVGIDTVILIRAGYKDQVTFNSQVLQEKIGKLLPVYTDLVQLFLTLAEKYGMTFYFGTYDSGNYWLNGDYQTETEINQAFCEEFIRRYGDYQAFGGWYISHEINTYDEGMMQVYEELSRHLKKLRDVPILISPYIKGIKQFGETAISFNEHITAWDSIFARLKGIVDIVAFQDGNVAYQDLPHYLQANCQLAKKYGLTVWSNVESFDRDVPWKFPPIDYRKLRYKIEQAEAAQVDKLITFEFSHFLSPNSTFPAARQLYQRYWEWITQR